MNKLVQWLEAMIYAALMLGVFAGIIFAIAYLLVERS